jgi:hypothetical protein
MQKYSILILPTLILIGCDNSTQPLTDQYAIVLGITVDPETNTSLDSVLVAYKHPDVEDSVVFVGDSVEANIPMSLLNRRYSSKGHFRFELFLSQIPPYPYELMFAYKSGYHVWRYDKTRDTVYHLSDHRDSLVIELTRKK